MQETIKEYDAKMDSKKRLTLRETQFEYYHVEHYADGKILLAPRELVEPFRVSANTLDMIDHSMKNLKAGDVSPEVDLSRFEE